MDYLSIARQYKLISYDLAMIAIRHMKAAPVLYERGTAWGLPLYQ